MSSPGGQAATLPLTSLDFEGRRNNRRAAQLLLPDICQGRQSHVSRLRLASTGDFCLRTAVCPPTRTRQYCFTEEHWCQHSLHGAPFLDTISDMDPLAGGDSHAR